MSRLFAVSDTLESDEWYTPRYIFDALDVGFDLDPCAPSGGVPWIPAQVHYTAEDDGLIQPWHGRVWLNPPYSQPWAWVERLADHGDGIALVPADTASKWWTRVGTRAEAYCFLRDRVTFVRIGNDNVTSARFPSVLLAWGDISAEAVRVCNLGWVVG